jgi:hypothetical protein
MRVEKSAQHVRTLWLHKGRDVVQRICNVFGPTKKIQGLSEREPFIFRIGMTT